MLKLLVKNWFLNLGYSHPISIEVPIGIEIKVEKNVVIIITGFDKELVGHLAATIRETLEIVTSGEPVVKGVCDT